MATRADVVLVWAPQGFGKTVLLREVSALWPGAVRIWRPRRGPVRSETAAGEDGLAGWRLAHSAPGRPIDGQAAPPLRAFDEADLGVEALVRWLSTRPSTGHGPVLIMAREPFPELLAEVQRQGGRVYGPLDFLFGPASTGGLAGDGFPSPEDLARAGGLAVNLMAIRDNRPQPVFGPVPLSVIQAAVRRHLELSVGAGVLRVLTWSALAPSLQCSWLAPQDRAALKRLQSERSPRFVAAHQGGMQIAEPLRTLLAASPDEEDLRSLADLLAASAQLSDALDVLSRHGLPDACAALLDAHLAPALLDGHVECARETMARFSGQALRADPRLAWHFCMVEAFADNLAAAERWVELLAAWGNTEVKARFEALARLMNPTLSVPGPLDVELPPGWQGVALLAHAAALVRNGRFETALAMLSARRVEGSLFERLWRTSLLAHCELMLGRPHEAVWPLLDRALAERNSVAWRTTAQRSGSTRPWRT